MTTAHYHPCGQTTCDHAMTAADVAAHTHEAWLAQVRAQRDVWACSHCGKPTPAGRTVCVDCADIP